MSLLSKIRDVAGEKGYSVAKIEKECGLGNGTIRRWDHSSPSCDKLVVVADFLNVSVDSLLERSSAQTSVTNSGSIGVIGSSHAPISIGNNPNISTELSAQEQDFIRIYRSLTGKEQHSLMSYAYELEEKDNKSSI